MHSLVLAPFYGQVRIIGHSALCTLMFSKLATSFFHSNLTIPNVEAYIIIPVLTVELLGTLTLVATHTNCAVQPLTNV